MDFWAPLETEDPEIATLVHDEEERTRSNLELIASESYPSLAVLQATGSILTGSTLYLGPSSANLPFKLQLTTLGANGVTSATWQGKSGSLQSMPATDTTATSTPFDSGVYTWDGTAPLNDSIQVSRDPSATVDSVNVVSDTNDPTGTISLGLCSRASARTWSMSIRWVIGSTL